MLDIPHQEQNLPGLDKKMSPVAQHTKLEAWDNEGKPYLKEYEGSGKLKGKAAIITGESGPDQGKALRELTASGDSKAATLALVRRG